MPITAFTDTTDSNRLYVGSINPKFTKADDGRIYLTYVWEGKEVVKLHYPPEQNWPILILHAR